MPVAALYYSLTIIQAFPRKIQTIIIISIATEEGDTKFDDRRRCAELKCSPSVSSIQYWESF